MIQRSHKKNFNVVIYRVQIKPLIKLHFSIPLRCLQCRPFFQPINEVDIVPLENEFVMGHHDGDRALYVSPYNNLDKVLQVSNDIQASWSSLWQEANEKFDAMPQNDSDLAYLARKMFHVWEGNHQLTVWWRHNYKHHPLDMYWQIFVDCNVVNPRNCTVVFLNDINDIKWFFFLDFFHYLMSF